MELRCGWPLSHLPTQCICAAQYDVQHSLSCKTKGFYNRQNQATKDVKIEPVLLLLTCETFEWGTEK